MSVSELIAGRRYWLGTLFGPQLVEMLGRVPGWPKKVRVRNPVTWRVAWVNADQLKACVEEVKI